MVNSTLEDVLIKTTSVESGISISEKISKLLPRENSLVYRCASDLVEDLSSKKLLCDSFNYSKEDNAKIHTSFAYRVISDSLSSQQRKEFEFMLPADLGGNFFPPERSVKERVKESLAVIFAFYGREGYKQVSDFVYDLID